MEMPSGWRALRESLRKDPSIPSDEIKYLDHDRWIQGAWRRAKRAGLDEGPRRSILDLGCGAGWFAWHAMQLGHTVIGVDTPKRSRLFREITRLLQVQVIEHEIKPMVPLPDSFGSWDVVTAFQVTFNGHRNPPIWGPNEWRCFIMSIDADEIYLELNREPSGVTITPELAETFLDLGAIGGGDHIVRFR